MFVCESRPPFGNKKGNVLRTDGEFRNPPLLHPHRGRTDAFVSPGLIIKPQFRDSRRQIMGIIIRARFVGLSAGSGYPRPGAFYSLRPSRNTPPRGRRFVNSPVLTLSIKNASPLALALSFFSSCFLAAPDDDRTGWINAPRDRTAPFRRRAARFRKFLECRYL